MEIGQKTMAIANKPKHTVTNQDLSIQISLNGLSFCILNNVSNTITHLKHFEYDKKLSPFQILDKLIELFDSETFLQDEFMNIKAIYVNDLSTLVPSSLFDENNLADYLKFNSKILRSDFIAYDHIAVNDSYNVYVPYVNINNYLFEKFGDFSYSHYSTILIEKFLKQEKQTDEAKMYIHLMNDHFEISVINQTGLVLYNTYFYNTKEDFIYYILFVVEQLHLDPEKIKVNLLGKIQEDDDFFQIVYKYIRNVELANLSSNHRVNEAIEKSSKSNFVLTNSF